ncbi:aminodeoxychorismate/anthranilate synthase component II [Paenibacillus sp. M1]|uniref:Aminodeoxychorismate/anthranilate synthase component II n=1 Tax=Paenibacillus haidiansis TaxID=1574488 RepID=A0ABU7VUK3_9BACL
MLLLVDNYDSFVYNIYHTIHYPENEIIVKRNDEFGLDDIVSWKVSKIIISPGPMSPLEAGISNDLITAYMDKLPILGICLGHQCIGHALGCSITRSANPMHGKKSTVTLGNSPLFNHLPGDIPVGRYHSLQISKEDFNERELDIISETEDGTIMAVQHKSYPLFGVQFHPESILTGEYGQVILNNFLYAV